MRALEVLSPAACRRHLTQQQIGRLAVVVGAEPQVFPVSFSYTDDAIVFQAAAGSKLAGIYANPTVAFEVDGMDNDRLGGWSVVVAGRAEVVSDPEEAHRLAATLPPPWVGEPGDQVVRIVPRSMTGRFVSPLHVRVPR